MQRAGQAEDGYRAKPDSATEPGTDRTKTASTGSGTNRTEPRGARDDPVVARHNAPRLRARVEPAESAVERRTHEGR